MVCVPPRLRHPPAVAVVEVVVPDQVVGRVVVGGGGVEGVGAPPGVGDVDVAALLAEAVADGALLELGRRSVVSKPGLVIVTGAWPLRDRWQKPNCLQQQVGHVLLQRRCPQRR